MRYWKPKVIPGNPVVSIIAAAYTVEQSRLRDALMAFIYCWKAQTYPHWELTVTHDGPGSGMLKAVADLGDLRVKLVETPERKQKFGHPWRQQGVDSSRGAWMLLTNADNLYTPVFLEWLLHSAVSSPKRCDMVYCDMVHSHRNWAVMNTAPYRGCLDLGSLLVRSDLARKVPFDNHEFHGDGVWIDRLRTLAEGAGAVVQKVPAALMVHN